MKIGWVFTKIWTVVTLRPAATLKDYHVIVRMMAHNLRITYWCSVCVVDAVWCVTGNWQHTYHGATHWVNDPHGRVTRQDAPARLRQRRRRQYGHQNHAGELHLDPEVQHYEEYEKGGKFWLSSVNTCAQRQIILSVIFHLVITVHSESLN